MKRAMILAFAFCLTVVAVPSGERPFGRPSEVIFCFDTEDFTCKRNADGIVTLAKICEDEGIKGHFMVVNAIVVYMLGPMFYYEPGGLGNATRFFLGALCSHVPTAIGEAIFQGGYVLVNWLVLLFLYRKNVFIKV